MTPIEVVAAKIERCLDLLDIDIDTEESLKIARLALLALAEVELPEEAINAAGMEMYGLEYDLDHYEPTPGEMKLLTQQAQKSFRAILRSLAGDLVQTTVGIPSGHQKTENVE